MSAWLLDANALIALGRPAHEQHHGTIVARFKRHAREGWATTAVTQSALVRNVSQPAFAGRVIAAPRSPDCCCATPRTRITGC